MPLNVRNLMPRIEGRSWYRIQAAGDDGVAEVMIYDEIGWNAISAEAFVRDLREISAETIRVVINSPGGNVFDGLAIHNALRAHPARIVARIDGLAASITSLIAEAADHIVIASNAFFMIHDPWAVAMGDAAEMRQMADTLEKVAGSMLGIYAARASADADQIRAWMRDETWFTAAEAKDAGFVDEVTEPGEASAHDLTRFRNAPGGPAPSGGSVGEKDLELVARMRQRMDLAARLEAAR